MLPETIECGWKWPNTLTVITQQCLYILRWNSIQSQCWQFSTILQIYTEITYCSSKWLKSKVKVQFFQPNCLPGFTLPFLKSKVLDYGTLWWHVVKKLQSVVVNNRNIVSLILYLNIVKSTLMANKYHDWLQLTVL